MEGYLSNTMHFGAIAAGLRSGKSPDHGGVAAIDALSSAPFLDNKRGLRPVGAHASRRRRLWELPHKYHCSLIGVCFDVAELRKMIGKILKYPPDTTDYVWHTIAVGVCDSRCPLSEQFNRVLDRCFARMIRQMSICKTTDQLRAAWRDVCRGGIEVPAGLWAACTHPACDGALEVEIHGDIHMLQHQIGAGARVDLKAMKTLQSEKKQLQQGIEAARKRLEQQRIEHVQKVHELNQRIMALQAELSVRETSNQRLQAEVSRLCQLMPDLDDRKQLLDRAQEAEFRMQAVRERERQLEKEVGRLRDCLSYAEEIIESLMPESTSACTLPGNGPSSPAFVGESLLGKCVLCVGGRSGAVNSYREMVEQCGGRFMHHDGGREESLHRIDGVLAAADIVICQVGCISHNAYWRVKEQCKRTGKPCMFVKNSGLSSFGRIVSEAGKQQVSNGPALQT